MPVYSLGPLKPKIGKDVFIAPGAQVIGDVEIGEGSSIWFNCVLRGDGNAIRIGRRCNIQDCTLIHITSMTHPTVIEDDVLVGHMAIVHGCLIRRGGFVGLGATVMDGCEIETDGMLAAGALLTPGKVIKSRQLWAGHPAKYVRDLTEDELAYNKAGVDSYALLAQEFRKNLRCIEPLDGTD